MKKISKIKDRVLRICEIKGINKEIFFSDIGMSYANFKGNAKNSALNSDAIANILTKYRDVNPEWLILGEGEMLRTNINNSSSRDNSNESNTLLFIIDKKDKRIEELCIENTLLKEKIIKLSQKEDAQVS